MMLTTKARYAVMAVLEVASNSQLKPLTLAEISAKQEIPLRYLEQIFSRLKKNGLVKSVRGPGGGYVMNRDLVQVTIYDIIGAVEENIAMTRCEASSNKGCMSSGSKCKTHHLWQGLTELIQNYLEQISVADITRREV